MENQACLCCYSPNTGKNGQYNSDYLDWESFNTLWSIFGGINGATGQSYNHKIFNCLTQFACLPFNDQKPNLYQIYLLTKPRNQCDHNYKKLKDTSLAILMNLIWTELKEFLGLSYDDDEYAQTRFDQHVMEKSVDQLERDAKKLFNDEPSWIDLKNIANSYGFSTPGQDVHRGKVFSRFGYDRCNLRHANDKFEQEYTCDRRRSNFAAVIFSCKKDHRPETLNWVKKVILDSLYCRFKNFTYDWFWIKNIDSLDSVITRSYCHYYSPSPQPSNMILSPVMSYTDSPSMSPDSNEEDNQSDGQVHRVTWNVQAFPSNGDGSSINIQPGDSINFLSTDNAEHDLVQTDENWQPLTDSLFSITPPRQGFDATITFAGMGTIYSRCNVHSNVMRLKINVGTEGDTEDSEVTVTNLVDNVGSVTQNNQNNKNDSPMNNWMSDVLNSQTDPLKVNDIFEQVLNSQQLVPDCQLPSYDFCSQFKDLINRWTLAEAVVRYFTWKFLRIPFLCNHSLLIQSLTVEQLKAIFAAQSVCAIMGINDTSSAWETFINEIGDVLLSRAVKQLSCCPTKSDNNMTNLTNGHKSDLDLDKELLRSWYNNDRDYALVALCNSLQADGSVDICTLMKLIQARVAKESLENELSNKRPSSIVTYNSDNRII